MVEISVRSRLAYEIGHQLGPQAYLDNLNFSDKQIHARLLTIDTLPPSLIPHMGFPPDWQSKPIWS